MSYKPRYDPGEWTVLCDACGRKFKANQLQRRWDGLMVCMGDWEPRQPQDFVKGIAEHIAAPWTRPEPSDSFVLSCEPNGITGISDWAIADCAICDYVHPAFNTLIEPFDCNALYYLTDDMVANYETVWGCTSLVVDDAALTNEGRIGIY